jgi:hypothetical protein
MNRGSRRLSFIIRQLSGTWYLVAAQLRQGEMVIPSTHKEGFLKEWERLAERGGTMKRQAEAIELVNEMKRDCLRMLELARQLESLFQRPAVAFARDGTEYTASGPAEDISAAVHGLDLALDGFLEGLIREPEN